MAKQTFTTLKNKTEVGAESQASGTGYDEQTSLANLALKVHNELRAKHDDTGPLTISDDCCKTAQFVANIGVFEHSKPHERNSYGENLGFAYGQTKEMAVERAVRGFYDEIEFYNYKSPRNVPKGEMVGHFTQVLIKIKFKVN